MNPSITDNPTLSRFELAVDGHTAFLVYERTPRSLTLMHTEVPPPLRGRHLGEALVQHALTVARSEHLRPLVVCPFARSYLRAHPSSLEKP